MKKIRFLILLVTLTSCNQYLGTIEPDYSPLNEVTEIFSNTRNDNYILEVDFGDIIYPKIINPSLIINNLRIDKIINTDKNSTVNFLNDKIFLSKDKIIYVIDNKNEDNNFEYKLNLNKDEEVLHIFEYKYEIYILTNTSHLFTIDGQDLIDLGDFEVFTNIKPFLLDNSLIIFSAFGDIYEINLDYISISKIDNIISNPGLSIKSNIFQNQENLYYLFNTGTLITFGKKNYDYYDNYILEDLNILTSLGAFNELVDSPFSHDEYLYFLDRSGKIAVYNPVYSDILWELDINDTIQSYLFSKDGYLILLTFDKILILSNNGDIINSYTHKKESPLSFFSIQGNIYLILEEGISKLNLNNKSEDVFFKNKFTSNLDIYYQDQSIYLKDDKSLFKLSE
ncbi:MAG: hypothetical protein CBD62_02855 [Candidatus Pelagibacter sp. TMED202]|nr:MAG: hypothetical protein CBD62_02855 [Candidatus Pelagibacter sp. TMED202]|tara:strand:+ start:3969 stop:5156 length:1188 start_codon:yes stop_codon:yes gene_type:complete